MEINHAYRPRRVSTFTPEEIEACHVKLYAIQYPDNAEPQELDWETARRLFASKRRQFTGNTESNLGYLILHKGRDANYIVCAWWSGENMTRMFSFRAMPEHPLIYLEVDDGLHICVWDMLIHNHERNSFVNHLLRNPGKPNREAYVRDYYQGET